MPQQAAPQGDGTGAGDTDPSFIRAVQREMQGEQAPQGLPPAQGQQMAQAPQDQGVQGDIAAGVRAASGFAYGGAVRGYQDGGNVFRVGDGKLRYNLDGLSNAAPSNPMFPQLTTPDVISGNLGPSVLGRPQVESEDEDSKYGAMFEDAGKKYLESSADETTPEDDRNSALLKFGLGMMTSASKPGATFLGAAGEGGLNAVSEFEKARASRAENRMKKLGLIGNLAEREGARKFQKAELAQQAELKREEIAKDYKVEANRLEAAGANRETVNALRISANDISAGNLTVQQALLGLQQATKDREALEAQAKLDNPTIQDPTYLTKVMESAEKDKFGANQAYNLADRFDELKPVSGALGVGNELLKSVLGTEDEVSLLRKDYSRFKNEGVMQSLPPGTSSDADVAFALKGFPDETYDAKAMAKFLRGMGKLKAASGEYNSGRAKFIQKTGTIGGAPKDFEINGIQVTKGQTFSEYSDVLRNKIFDPYFQKKKNDAAAARPNTKESDALTGFNPGDN